MTRIEAFLTEAEDAPEELLEETLQFLRFLKSRRNPDILDTARVETMLLRSSLKTIVIG